MLKKEIGKNNVNNYILKLKEVVVDFFKNEDAKIVLFGSRARNTNYVSSDVDIGILPGSSFHRKRISLLREKIEILNIPYKIEIVDLSETSFTLRQEALREGIVWKD